VIYMNIIYRNYEPGKGLEEQQAELFTKSTGNPATADQIRERYEREKIDPKTVIYAFSEDKMLAYVQARDYPDPLNETHVGYPHVLESCPEGVRDKMFDDLLAYMKQRKEMETLALRANTGANEEKKITFLKKRGFVEKTRGYRYGLDVNEISKVDYTGDYSSKTATIDDLDKLADLMLADNRYAGQFQTREDLVTYFRDKVLADGKCVLISKGDDLVMASAPLFHQFPGDDKQRLVLRFHSFLPGNEKALELLLIEIAKECVKANFYTDEPLTYYSGEGDQFFDIMEGFKHKSKEVTGIQFGL